MCILLSYAQLKPLFSSLPLKKLFLKREKANKVYHLLVLFNFVFLRLPFLAFSFPPVPWGRSYPKDKFSFLPQVRSRTQFTGHPHFYKWFPQFPPISWRRKHARPIQSNFLHKIRDQKIHFIVLNHHIYYHLKQKPLRGKFASNIANFSKKTSRGIAKRNVKLLSFPFFSHKISWLTNMINSSKTCFK